MNNASTPTVIHSAHVVSRGTTSRDAWVRFENGMVVARGHGSDWRAGVNGNETVIDAHGAVLTPGFIDIHCHGGGGASVEDGVSAIETSLETHRSHGTTRTLLSLVSAPVDSLVTCLETIADVASRDPRVLGAHLEGPFLAHDFRGAHDPAALRIADDRTVDRLLTAGNGYVRQITLAPERLGAESIIRTFVNADVAVAVGHTAVDRIQALRAFEVGATILTHAFNGMRGIHHRAPGPVIAAMESSHVTLEIINDGVHVDSSVVSLAFANAPGRVAMITDAMAAAGAEDGNYRLGPVDVVVSGGVALLADGSSIAGSTLTLDDALRRAVFACGIELEDAVTSLTSVPATAIGRADDLGRLEPGFSADAVLLSEELQVLRVWAMGEQIHAEHDS